MLPIELRQNKASMSCMLWMLGLVAAGIFLYLFFSRSSGINPIKIIICLAACGITYVVWSTTKRVRTNEPLLTFLKEGLEINETQPVMVLWQDITSWDVTRSNATDYLIIKTGIRRRSINISWLEVKPDEVKALMNKFTQASASGNI
jgi:hypothetical protein